MAITAATAWNVRSTGSNTQCAGGFDPSFGGTDYSQQDTAIATGTVTSSGTTVTATTSIFTSLMVGNCITDGTTTKQITGYTNGTTVTVDAAPSWTSTTIYVGGGLASLDVAHGYAVTGNRINIKSGSYSVSATTTITKRVNISGYGTSPGDYGTAPVITASSGSFYIITFTTSNDASIENVVVDGNSGSLSCGGFIATSVRTSFYRCTAQNCKTLHSFNSNNPSLFILCYANQNNGGRGFSISGSCYRCAATGCTGQGFFAASFAVFKECISFSNSATGFNDGTVTCSFENCVSYNNSGGTSDGFTLSSSGSVVCVDCISVSNGRYGFNVGSVSTKDAILLNCASYANGTSGTNGTPWLNSGFVTLSGDPFTNAGGNDFSLNNTAGAGASCRFAGTTLFPIGSTPYNDIGAVQTKASSGILVPIGFAGGFDE